MRHPPDPLYSFTIPSVHDDTALDCRIYHPDTPSHVQSTGPHGQTPHRTRGIVMAHPYAPMGGSYDDRVVGIVLDEFLKAGWIVGTFNFRGVHGSKARTSWSGRPEHHDYTSFAACFIHYLCYLQPYPTPDAINQSERSPISPTADSSHLHAGGQADTTPVVILGGYSYGSLIVKHLPVLSALLEPFVNPIAGSAGDEILTRARKLAEQTNLVWRNNAHNQEREGRSRTKGHKSKSSITMGGEETTPEKRRTSREVRRSVDRSLNIEFGNRLRSLSHSHHRHKDDSPPVLPETVQSVPIPTPRVHYLLVSPLTPPLATLAAPALGHKFWKQSRTGFQDPIAQHETLAIYGNRDIFTSAKRLQDWSEQLKAMPGSRFSSVEVAGAGHFWVEGGVEEKLRSALSDWEAGVR